jgi:hypothetical protein
MLAMALTRRPPRLPEDLLFGYERFVPPCMTAVTEQQTGGTVPSPGAGLVRGRR